MSTIAVAFHAPHDTSRRQDTLWVRIGILLILVIALVLVLISYLNYSNYRKAYLDLNLTRYTIVAKDVRQTVLGGLNVGLRPAENTRLLPSIKEQTRRENGIRFIAVIDESGTIIGDGKFGDGAPARWHSRLAKTLPENWQTSDADTIEIGIPFVNNFNIKAGAVILGYNKTAIESAASDMLRKLAVDVLVTLLFLAVLTFGGVYIVTRRFCRVVTGVAATIDAALHEGAPLTVDGDFLGAGVAQEINDFTALSHGLVTDLAALERDVAASPATCGAGREEGA
jgi:hypothetical protein